MSHDHPFGKPVSVLTTSDCNEVIVDESEVEKLFDHPELQYRKIVILSTIGAFRGGKSFFLDYCLRFLYAHFPSINNPQKETQMFFTKNDNWMGSSEEPLKGFSWISGTKRDTTGILIWSDIFLHTIDISGEKIAILVMDTQGLFDTESTPTDNSRIFALGTLISSIQVLNLKSRVQEDQLQYLQFATEFAKFSVKENEVDNNSFQNLTILIRDWYNYADYAFGIEGGKKYLEEEVLKINPSQKSELTSVRESIRSSFESLECCLLPCPGKKVAGSKDYDGKWSEMDEEFKAELKKFIEQLLLPENMFLKKINSQEVTCAELKNYIIQYLSVFQSGDLPETLTIYELTVESSMNNLIKKCIDDYKLTMFRNKEHAINEESIQIMHEKCKERALNLFDSEHKMGSADHEEKFRAKLDEEIESIFKFFSSQNDLLNQEVEDEAKRQQALLDGEKQQKLEAEIALKQAEIRLNELEKAKNEMKAEKYERLRKIAEARREAENNKLQKIENKVIKENKFTLLLLSFIAGVVGLGLTLMPGGIFIAGLALRGVGTASAILTATKCTIM